MSHGSYHRTRRPPLRARRVRPEVSREQGVYPNPTKGEAFVTYRLPEGASQGELLVHDATGRLVRGKSLAGNGIEELPKGMLPPGVYTVALRADGMLVTTVKFIALR